MSLGSTTTGASGTTRKRTGKGKNGVVMRGYIMGEPYPDEDWSGKGRRVYYIRMKPLTMLDPERAPMMITTDELSEKIPGFDWKEGHSGMILSDEQAAKLEVIWDRYAERM